MTFFSVLEALVLVVSLSVVTAVASTLGLLGLARLEVAVVRPVVARR